MSIPYEELEALIIRQYKEIEELQNLCARAAVLSEHPYWEKNEWDIVYALAAAGRRELISSNESKHPQEEL